MRLCDAMTIMEAGLRQPEESETIAAGSVFIFDQVEDLLRLQATDWDGQREFFRQLGDALEDQNRWALLSIREDFMGGLERIAGELPTQLRHRFRLEFLGKKEAALAVTEPARAAGASFDPEAAKALIADLSKVSTETPEGELSEESGPFVEPLMLQVACYQLWATLLEKKKGGVDHVSVKDVAEHAAVGDALGKYYARAARRVAKDSGVAERDIRNWAEDKLIRAGMRVPTTEGPCEEIPEANLNALEGLEQAYLIRAEMRDIRQLYELSHDRLMRPIRLNNRQWRSKHLAPWQELADKWVRGGETDDRLLRQAAELGIPTARRNGRGHGERQAICGSCPEGP